MTTPIGILLAQLGTPESPTPRALRRYLRQFLGDPRVIEMNPLGRWLLLNLVILPLRPRTSAELYRRIWTPDGSPLLITTRAQADALGLALGPGIQVAFGMSYGDPSIASALDGLCAKGAEKILIFPMYPQYSSPTTGSLCDGVSRWIQCRRFVPALRFVPPYYAHPAYVEAVSAVTREHLSTLPFRAEKTVFSFHGLPKRYLRLGDPYEDQAKASVRLIARALGLSEGEWMLTFQSRFGREEWLRPYTDETLAALPKEGVRRIAVVCPGFTSDCLETIDEIGHMGREQFRASGGGELSLVPCLNTHRAWIEGMARIAREELSGWLR